VTWAKGDRDLPVADRMEPAVPPLDAHEKPGDALRRWLRLRGDHALADEMLAPRGRERKPDQTPYEDRLERIWTGETTEPGQDG
jgi:hypothetical protein